MEKSLCVCKKNTFLNWNSLKNKIHPQGNLNLWIKFQYNPLRTPNVITMGGKRGVLRESSKSLRFITLDHEHRYEISQWSTWCLLTSSVWTQRWKEQPVEPEHVHLWSIETVLQFKSIRINLTPYYLRVIKCCQFMFLQTTCWVRFVQVIWNSYNASHIAFILHVRRRRRWWCRHSEAGWLPSWKPMLRIVCLVL